MSLYIDIAEVEKVLLADGWHAVTDFHLDSYEFHADSMVLLRGGQVEGVPSVGFIFTDTETRAPVFGPLTSVLAVSYKEAEI